MAEDLRQKIVIVTDQKELKALIGNMQKSSNVGKQAGKNISTAGKKASKSWGGIGKSMKGLKNELSSILPLFGRISALGPAAVFVGLAAGLAKATKEAAFFEQRMAEVATLVDTTQISVKKMTNEIISLSTRGPLGLIDLTEGLYDLVSAGVDANRSVEVLEVAMKAAVGGVTEAEVAIDGITSAMNAWGIEASKSIDIADSFFVAIRNGKTTFAELSASIGQLGPIAAATGVSLDEVMAATAAITTAGVRTNLAMTQMRSLLVAIARQVPQTQKVAQSLNLDFTVSNLRAKGLKAFLDEVLASSKGDETALTRLVGRIEALNAIIQLSGSQSEKFAKNLEDMRTKAGSTDAAFRKMKETALSMSKTITNQINAAFVKLGLSILPTVNKALQDFSDLLRGGDSTLRKVLNSLEDIDVDPEIKFRIRTVLDLQETRKREAELERELTSNKFRVPLNVEVSRGTMAKLRGVWDNMAEEMADSVASAFESSQWMHRWGLIAQTARLLFVAGMTVKAAAVDGPRRGLIDLAQSFTPKLGADGRVVDPGLIVESEYFDQVNSTVAEGEAALAILADKHEEVLAQFQSGQNFSDIEFENQQKLVEIYGESIRLMVQWLAGKKLVVKENELLLKQAADLTTEAQELRKEQQATVDEAKARIEREGDAFTDSIAGRPASEVKPMLDKRIAELQAQKLRANMQRGIPKDLINQEVTALDQQLILLNDMRNTVIPEYDRWKERVEELTSAVEKAQSEVLSLSDEAEREGASDFLKDEISRAIELRNQITELQEIIATLQEARDNAVPEGVVWTKENAALLEQAIQAQADLADLASENANRIKAKETFKPLLQSILDGADGAGFSDLQLGIDVEAENAALTDAVEHVLELQQRQLSMDEAKLRLGLKVGATEEEKAEMQKAIDALGEEARQSMMRLGGVILQFAPSAAEATRLISEAMSKFDIPEGPVKARVREVVEIFESELGTLEANLVMGEISKQQFQTDVAGLAEKAKASVAKISEELGVELSPKQLEPLTALIKSLAENALRGADALDSLEEAFKSLASVAGAIGDIASSIDGISDAAQNAIQNVSSLFSRIADARNATKTLMDAGSAATLGQKLAVAGGALGVVAGVASLVGGLMAASKQRKEQHRQEILRMIELQRALRDNTREMEKRFASEFEGGISARGTTEGQVQAAQDLLRNNGLPVHGNQINPIDFGITLPAGFPEANPYLADTPDGIRAAEEFFSAVEDLDIPKLTGFSEQFQAAMDAGLTVNQAFQSIFLDIQQFVEKLESDLGTATFDVAGALEVFNTLTSTVGVGTEEAMATLIGTLKKMNLGPVFYQFLDELLAIDLSTTDGRKEFKDKLLDALQKMLSGDLPKDFLKGLKPEELTDLVSSMLGSLGDLAEGLQEILQTVTDSLSVFTDLLGKDGVEAFQFFIDQLLKSESDLGEELTTILRRSKGLDLTTQEGQNQLDAIVKSLGQSIIDGTTMDDFGVAADELEDIARSLQQVGRSAFDEGFSSSTSIARTLTDIQGNEVIILLNSIDHGIRSLVESASRVANVSASDASYTYAIPASLNGAISSVGSSHNNGASLSNSSRNAVELHNHWNITIPVSPSIDQSLIEMNKKVKEKYMRTQPRR